MDLNELRNEIDSIDNELVSLFARRMAISGQVADYKREHGLPILVPAREREILQKVADMAGPEMGNYARVLYSMIFELSRNYQSKRNNVEVELNRTISDAIENTPKLFPQNPMVACQGTIRQTQPSVLPTCAV